MNESEAIIRVENLTTYYDGRRGLEGQVRFQQGGEGSAQFLGRESPRLPQQLLPSAGRSPQRLRGLPGRRAWRQGLRLQQLPVEPGQQPHDTD
ncbi:hypothetical protein MYX77_13215, partial [Acidobacteriia bacterium AH_259_A11_L15]|nr:hypothetical protein [Acidobacteriia bacterium AH_259_A11_L15]